MVNDIITWIKESREKGWADNLLKNILSDRGYSEEEIDKAFSKLDPEMPQVDIAEEVTKTVKKKAIIFTLISIITLMLAALAFLFYIILSSAAPVQEETCEQFMARIGASFPCEYFIMEKDLPEGYSIKTQNNRLSLGTNALHDITFGPTEQIARWDIVIYINQTAQISLNVLTFNEGANRTENFLRIENRKNKTTQSGAPLKYYLNEDKIIILNPLIDVMAEDINKFDSILKSRNLTEQ